MISPKSFRDSFKDESLETCIKEKNKLEKEIKDFKEGKNVDTKMSPQETVVNKFIELLQGIIQKLNTEEKTLAEIGENLGTNAQESASATAEILANIDSVRKIQALDSIFGTQMQKMLAEQ